MQPAERGGFKGSGRVGSDTDVRILTVSTEIICAGSDSQERWEVKREGCRERWGGKSKCSVWRADSEMEGERWRVDRR